MNLADELERLKRLHEQGGLSDAEFAQAKAKLLDADFNREASGQTPSILSQLHRSRHDRMLGGVCGGLAQVTSIPAWAWRVLFCVAVLGAGFGVLLYLLLWFFIPEAS